MNLNWDSLEAALYYEIVEVMPFRNGDLALFRLVSGPMSSFEDYMDDKYREKS